MSCLMDTLCVINEESTESGSKMMRAMQIAKKLYPKLKSDIGTVDNYSGEERAKFKKLVAESLSNATNVENSL